MYDTVTPHNNGPAYYSYNVSFTAVAVDFADASRPTILYLYRTGSLRTRSGVIIITLDVSVWAVISYDRKQDVLMVSLHRTWYYLCSFVILVGLTFNLLVCCTNKQHTEQNTKGSSAISNLAIAASNTRCNEALLMSFAHGLAPGV